MTFLNMPACGLRPRFPNWLASSLPRLYFLPPLSSPSSSSHAERYFLTPRIKTTHTHTGTNKHYTPTARACHRRRLAPPSATKAKPRSLHFRPPTPLPPTPASLAMLPSLRLLRRAQPQQHRLLRWAELQGTRRPHHHLSVPRAVTAAAESGLICGRGRGGGGRRMLWRGCASSSSSGSSSSVPLPSPPLASAIGLEVRGGGRGRWRRRRGGRRGRSLGSRLVEDGRGEPASSSCKASYAAPSLDNLLTFRNDPIYPFPPAAVRKCHRAQRGGGLLFPPFSPSSFYC